VTLAFPGGAGRNGRERAGESAEQAEVRTMGNTREGKGGGPKTGDARAKPVDDFMDELGTIQSETATAKNMVSEAVADGSLSEEYLRRLAMEYYFVGRSFTTEFGSLVANAPDGDGFSKAGSEHFRHWASNLAAATGSGGGSSPVETLIEWNHQLGVTDEELVSATAMPETIGMVFTTLYYMRRSYEEGLAAFSWAGARFAASTGYTPKMYEGMRDHYGIEMENFRVHAYAEENHEEQADYLLRRVAMSVDQQHRIRRAVRHSLAVRNMRTVALNGWLDEPGALRRNRG
jgi:pyrroloquinoline quinone (PQQ) biosynthesis protein C